MTDKYTLIRRLLYILEIFFFYVLQGTYFIPTIFNTKPILILTVALSVAMYEGENIGTVFGALCGLLIDVSINGIIGFNGLIMCIICFIVGYISSNYINVNLPFYLLISLVSIIVNAGINFIFLSDKSNIEYFLWFYLPTVIYTFSVSPIFYFFNKSIFLKVRN